MTRNPPFTELLHARYRFWHRCATQRYHPLGSTRFDIPHIDAAGIQARRYGSSSSIQGQRNKSIKPKTKISPFKVSGTHDGAEAVEKQVDANITHTILEWIGSMAAPTWTEEEIRSLQTPLTVKFITAIKLVHDISRSIEDDAERMTGKVRSTLPKTSRPKTQNGVREHKKRARLQNISAKD